MGVTFDAVLAATARARAAGALFSIETTANTVNDGGFTVRSVVIGILVPGRCHVTRADGPCRRSLLS